MTDVEGRLRRDLPALADALSGTKPGDGDQETDQEAGAAGGPAARPRGRRKLVLAACAALLLAAGFVVNDRDGTDRTAVDAVDRSLAPEGPGAWDVLPDAPIDPRAYPVSMWTGTEALFWAGSSLDRSFAYGDGAAYEPSTDEWRVAPVPGWGHPGLISVDVDGQLFATAKGSIGRLDVDTGEWIELPTLDSIEVRSIAPGAGGIWALGPRSDDPRRLAVAFHDLDTGRWAEGNDLAGDDGARAVEALTDLDQTPLWTGTELVVWAEDRGFAYRPEGGWMTLPALPAAEEETVASVAIVHSDELVVFVEATVGERRSVEPFRLNSSAGWTPIGDGDLPVADLARTTVTSAGDSIMLIQPKGPPVSLHVPSGEVHEHIAAPIQGIERPGVVWTGSQLVVWGGVPDDAGGSNPRGMRWTPGEEPSTTDDSTSSTSRPATETAWSGAVFADLPPSGIAIVDGDEIVLHDFAGNELSRGTTPATSQLQDSNDRLLAAVRPGPAVDAVPADLSEVPDDCESAATGGGVRVARRGRPDRGRPRGRL